MIDKWGKLRYMIERKNRELLLQVKVNKNNQDTLMAIKATIEVNKATLQLMDKIDKEDLESSKAGGRTA